MGESSDVKVVEAVKPVKLPPSESAKNVWRKRLIILSFWCLILSVGVPMWWKTTLVYRADLPLELMTNWANGQVCSPVFPMRIGFDLSSLSRADAETFMQETQRAIDTTNQSPTHVIQLVPQNLQYSGPPSSLKVELRVARGTSKPQTSIQPHTNVLQISHPKSVPTEELATYVAEQLENIFAEEKAIFSQLTPSAADSGSFERLTQDVADSVRRRATRIFKYAGTYHLTFSLFTPEAFPSGWDIEKALKKTFLPLLDALSTVGNFSLETQVQPYAVFASSLQPQFEDKEKRWVIRREELGGFVNAAEWPLSPTIGSGPTINFVLYVPSALQSPMIVQSSTSNSWVVPQWGVIAIHNPRRKSATQNPTTLTEAELQPALVTFQNQLLSLVGFPKTPSESFPLRLDTLVRVRAASFFLSASSTLGSLARLVEQLPSISIPDSVAENVELTLENLNLACHNFRAGDFLQALKHAGQAEAKAEKAFFEKSMVGQVYFPDEHKVAVYLPLLGPIAVPLVVAGLTEIRPLVQKLRRRAG